MSSSSTISPIFQNPVKILLELCISTGIWAQDYTDDTVVFSVGRDTQTASELMQNALPKIESWAYHRVGQRVKGSQGGVTVNASLS